MRGVMLSKSLIKFSVDGWGLCSLLFDLRPNYGGGNEDNGDLLQKVCCTQSPCSCGSPPEQETCKFSSVVVLEQLLGDTQRPRAEKPQ